MSEAALREPLAPPRLPRLGFLGVGWIGRARLDALAALGAAQIAAVADASAPLVEDACAHYPAAAGCASLGELLERDLDGIVIATPNALHAEQAITALEAGLPVFCPKPLARNGA